MVGKVEGRGRAAYVVGLVVLVCAAILFALACLGGIIGAAGSAAARARSGDTFGGDVALAIVSFAIVVACVAGAVHLEHQLRRHHPVAQSWVAPYTRRDRGMAWPRSRRGRRYSPAVMAIQAVVFAGFTIGMIVGTFVVHSEAAHSSRVQHHGLTRLATEMSVRNHWHSTRSGGYYTADVSADFQPPVDGRTTTLVHYPGRVTAPIGTRYAVLIDPADPGYAEFRGSPSTRTSSWIVMLVFAIFFGVFDVFFARALFRHLRHRRAASLPPALS